MADMGDINGGIYLPHMYGGGGATAGQNYYHALSGVGNDIARAMMYYHQQHVKYDQQYGLADALSRLGVSQDGTITPITPDASGKVDKSIKPIIDPKALQLFQARTQSERVKNMGALEALSRLGAKQMEKVLADPQGLKDTLLKQRTDQSLSRTRLNQAQLGKVLGLIPQTAPMPTGGQVLAEQRSLRKEQFAQRNKIADSLLVQKVKDPQMLLGGVQFQMPKSGFHIQEGPIVDPQYDSNGNIIPPDGAESAVLDDGTKIPIKQFQRLYPQAQQWQQLGQPMSAIKAPPPHDIQTLLSNPSDPIKAMFDKHYGQGAADLVIRAQGTAAAAAAGQQAQQAAPPDATVDTGEPAEDTSTAGENDTPPTDEPSDAGGG